MASVAQLQKERKSALSKAKAQQRTLDSRMERVERKFSSLRSKKKLIIREDVVGLDPLWREFVAQVNSVEKAISDFIAVCSL